jgi:hypothetical protein
LNQHVGVWIYVSPRTLWATEACCANTCKAEVECVCCVLQQRLVGVKAPDFEAEAVYDQEFINVSLEKYQYATICPLSFVIEMLMARAGHSHDLHGLHCTLTRDVFVGKQLRTPAEASSNKLLL